MAFAKRRSSAVNDVAATWHHRTSRTFPVAVLTQLDSNGNAISGFVPILRISRISHLGQHRILWISGTVTATQLCSSQQSCRHDNAPQNNTLGCSFRLPQRQTLAMSANGPRGTLEAKYSDDSLTALDFGAETFQGDA